MSAPDTAQPVFEPQQVNFTWTNEAWSVVFLPSVRVATRVLAKDEGQLLNFLATIGIETTTEMIELLTRATAEMEQLHDIVKVANARICVMSDVAFPETADARAKKASDA